MNKNAIKKFAIDARNKLIASVTDKAGMLGITPDNCSEAITKGADFEVYKTAAGTEVTLNKKQCEQRRKLVAKIYEKGFESVVEEVAYTWFNRICAIRFMEVNDYMYPVRVRVLSSEKEGKNEPDVVTMAPDIDWNFTDKEREEIIDDKMNGSQDALFRKLFLKQCNLLHEVLPGLFEGNEDYMEPLLTLSYTDKDGIIYHLIHDIEEDDFNVEKEGQVEIIGWLYQYYISEKHDEIINIYKGTIKKDDIPAATQLFTTDWVVRYMVDNSLGRYWIERNPQSKLAEKLEFYVTPKNGEIQYVDEKISPTDLTFFDPCMGSGHILVYAFDVLMEIYREGGYSVRDAALNIVENNIFGMDIDKRAYQLAYFAVMMKARSYNRRALTQGIKNNLTWSDITSASFSGRYSEKGFIFDIKGSSGFPDEEILPYVLGFLNSSVSQNCIKILNPTITTQVGDMARIPVIIDSNKRRGVEAKVSSSISISKTEWDSFEISWDFKKHPLCKNITNTVSGAFEVWARQCDNNFNQLKANEEKINQIFIDIYGLQDELTSEVEDKDITICKADLYRDVKSLISYAVGCMFGRYSLEADGLIYAGGEWDSNRYKSFIPDEDNCIPITDEEYFSDDIVGRLVEFIKTVYGADTLEENLDFIANALGNKGDTSREIIRNYFLKDFYTDHLKVYQKRPIYWMFDSGKQNGFKALIYMHRYDADTVGRVRTDYLHRAQKYVETAMQSAQYTIDNATSSSEKSKATKAVTKYTKQLAEMKIYDEAIAHVANQRIEIDLDDGVKVNYAKFQGVEVAQEGKKALKVDLLAKI